MLATHCDHKEVIQSLLKKKANPNITDEVGLCLHVWIILYSLGQMPRLLFISSPEFVRRLFESGVY